MDYAAAGSTSFTYKECKVNCSSSGGSKAQATTTSVYPAVCHVSATIQYTSKKDASVRNDVTSEKKATVSVSVEVGAPSNYVCTYVNGKHKATVGGSTSSVHNSYYGSKK